MCMTWKLFSVKLFYQYLKIIKQNLMQDFCKTCLSTAVAIDLIHGSGLYISQYALPSLRVCWSQLYCD